LPDTPLQFKTNDEDKNGRLRPSIFNVVYRKIDRIKVKKPTQ